MKGYIYIDKKNDYYKEIRNINFSVEKEDNLTNYCIDLCDEDDLVIVSVPINRTMYFYMKQHIERFNQGMEYLIKKVLSKSDIFIEIQKFEKETIQYYKGNLELSRRHILWEITNNIDEESYRGFVDEWLDKFKNLTGVEIELLGRSGRHCCIKDTDKNRLNYESLKDQFNSFQDDFVYFINDIGV